MLTIALSYLIISFAGLISLAIMILRIGDLLGHCPRAKATAKAASVTIATGFAAIGAGGIILIGGLLPVLPSYQGAVLMFALGLAALCLGLGFTQAVANLRAVLMDAPSQADPI